MKKLLLIALLLVFPSLSFALVTNSTVWEYRASATNDNLNGGIYDSTIAGAGTDYSLQDAAQISLTDITCAQNSVTINSASGLFTSAMVGNGMQFTNAGSHTAGFYIVTQFISTQSVKLNTTPYTGAGTSSGGTAKLGGALYLPTDTLLEYMVSGNVCYIKNGTYTLTGAISIGTAIGAATRQIMLVGYDTTRGDTPRGNNRPSIVQGSNAVTLGANWQIMNIRFSGSRAGSTLVSMSNPSLFYNCAFDNTANNSSSSAFQANLGALVECDFKAQYGRALVGSGGTLIYGSYIHDSVVGLLFGSTNWIRLINSVVDSCTTGMIQNGAAGSSAIIANNAFYNNTTAIDSSGGFLRSTSILNNIFHGGSSVQTNCILDNTTNVSNVIKNNLFYNYTNSLYSGMGTLDSTNITGQDPLMADPENGNFSLTTGSPAYNTGLGVSNSGVTGTYYYNIGVDQEQPSTGSGQKSWAY